MFWQYGLFDNASLKFLNRLSFYKSTFVCLRKKNLFSNCWAWRYISNSQPWFFFFGSNLLYFTNFVNLLICFHDLNINLWLRYVEFLTVMANLSFNTWNFSNLSFACSAFTLLEAILLGTYTFKDCYIFLVSWVLSIYSDPHIPC